MELRFVDAIENKECYKNATKLYSSAFPPAEKIPLSMLKRTCKKGKAKFFGVYDARKFVGILYLVLMDDIISVFYFAVDENLRGKGYGSAILSAMKEKYPGTRIFLEIEKTDEHAKNNAERLRRKAFYERNGFAPCGFDVTEFGVTYEILSFGGAITMEEYRDIMRYFAGKFFYNLIYKRMLERE